MSVCKNACTYAATHTHTHTCKEKNANNGDTKHVQFFFLCVMLNGYIFDNPNGISLILKLDFTL